jgi:hypothetical protein
MQLLDRFKKALAGEGGEALVLQIEREAQDKTKALAERRRLDAEVREHERQKKEELPKLREKTASARAEVDRIRKEVLAAERIASDASSEESSLHWSIQNGVNRARIALAKSAWPWLHDAIEQAWDRRRDWQNYGWERHRWFRSEKVAVAPDPSDPDYRVLMRNGGYYKMERFGSNKAALDVMREGMNQAVEQLERLLWRVEEPSREEVAALMTAFAEETWAAAAKNVVWIEPKAPRYDKNGEPLAA